MGGRDSSLQSSTSSSFCEHFLMCSAQSQTLWLLPRQMSHCHPDWSKNLSHAGCSLHACFLRCGWMDMCFFSSSLCSHFDLCALGLPRRPCDARCTAKKKQKKTKRHCKRFHPDQTTKGLCNVQTNEKRKKRKERRPIVYHFQSYGRRAYMFL